MELDFIESLVNTEYTNIVSPFQIYRVQSSGERLYFQLNEQNQPTYYLSVTSFCGRSLGISPQLAKNYFGVLGTEQAELKADLAAHYGTMMHIEIGKFFSNDYSYNFGSEDNDALLDTVQLYLQANNLHHSLAYEWRDNLQNDLASFITWVQEKNVQWIAMEFRICSDTYKLAGSIDLVCELDFDGKRVKAIVDFKSGRKGFYESHILQLKAYATIWNEHYRNFCPITHIFNWSPKEWRSEPTYNFKNQTKEEMDFKARAQIALNENWLKSPRSNLRINGVVTKNTPIQNNISFIEPHSRYVKTPN